jgi:hypothetical protein
MSLDPQATTLAIDEDTELQDAELDRPDSAGRCYFSYC